MVFVEDSRRRGIKHMKLNTNVDVDKTKISITVIVAVTRIFLGVKDETRRGGVKFGTSPPATNTTRHTLPKTQNTSLLFRNISRHARTLTSHRNRSQNT